MALRRPIKVRGSDYVLMTKFGKVGAASKEIEYGGTIGRYTEIRADGDWLDMHLLTEAGANRLREIEIPDDLKPNYEPFFFILSKEHLVAFETYSEFRSLGPSLAHKWMAKLVKAPAIKQEFGDVEVDLVPINQSLTRSLNWKVSGA